MTLWSLDVRCHRPILTPTCSVESSLLRFRRVSDIALDGSKIWRLLPLPGELSGMLEHLTLHACKLACPLCTQVGNLRWGHRQSAISLSYA